MVLAINEFGLFHDGIATLFSGVYLRNSVAGLVVLGFASRSNHLYSRFKDIAQNGLTND